MRQRSKTKRVKKIEEHLRDYGASLNGPHIHYRSSREGKGKGAESLMTKKLPKSEERNRLTDSRRLTPTRINQRDSHQEML